MWMVRTEQAQEAYHITFRYRKFLVVIKRLSRRNACITIRSGYVLTN